MEEINVMEKKKSNKVKKEFEISYFKKEKVCLLHFSFPDMILNLILTHKKWKDLQKYVKQTKSKYYLPKHTVAYREINIDKGKFYYIPVVSQKSPDFQLLMKLAYEKDMKNIKKTLLNKEIGLVINDTLLRMDRKKFIRFRKCCLSPKKHLRKGILPYGLIIFLAPELLKRKVGNK